MVEIVFCRVTRRGRKKRSGMNKLARENCRNDGPMQSFIPPDNMVKLTLDLSDTGPVFSALDDMMLKMSMDGIEDAKGKPKGGNAKAALKNLLKSGIPGIEGMFGGEDPTPRFGKKGGGKKGFHKMNDQSKKKFMSAIFGEEGTQIDSATAAALLAATCSQGNPDIGNKLAELLVPEMDEKVDPAMMAALMSACSLINAGAGTEEVLAIMKMELAASGLSEEEILKKTQLLMKAFGKEEAGSTAEYKLLSKQKNKALIKAEIPPKDFTAIVLAHKAIASCGASPENCAKVLMIYSTLAKKGANPAHVAQAMKNLGSLSDETKQDCKDKILKNWENTKITKNDVMVPVRMHQALDNENEPGWAEVKSLKDIVGGVSPNSPEAIELNLARATKSGGLKKDDIGRALVAFKAISALGIDPPTLAKILFMEKTICENGVPGSEVGRVLQDGVMPAEATQSLIEEVKDKICDETKPVDIELTVNVYNNLKFKSNIPTEVIEFVDKSLIQVRCSLEDVADNMISSLSARGEKTSRIVSSVTEMLKKTGATAHVTATTLMPPLVELTGEQEVVLTKTVARNLKDVDYENEEIKGAMTDMIVKIIEDDPSQHAEGVSSIEQILKDTGMSLPEIKAYVGSNLPPPPTPPEEVERRRQMAEELERLQKEEEERERLAALKLSDPEAYEREVNPKAAHKGIEGLKSDSRRGSLKSESRRGSLLLPESRSRQGSIVLGGSERRGSYYHDEVTTRQSVAMVTDDPEHKKKLKSDLAGAFAEDGSGGVNGDLSTVISKEGEDDDEVFNGVTNGISKQGIPGSLPAGTAVQKNPDGTISVGGKKLPPGASLQTNPDGTVSVTGDLPPGAKIERNKDGTVTVNGTKMPPEVTVVTNPDGTVSITANPLAGTKLPQNAVANADGSISLPKGTQIQQNPDGSFCIDGQVLPPGTQVQKKSDGTISLISSAVNGTKINTNITTAKDGTVTVGGVQMPAGTKASESGTMLLPKGTDIKTNEDGTVSIDGHMLPPGTEVRRNDDGSISLFSGGMTATNVSTNKDGTVAIQGITLPKGAKADDSGKVSLPKGTEVVKNSDGSISVGGKKLPNGTTTLMNPDGSISLIAPPASESKGQFVDGTEELGGIKLPDGAGRNIDGSISLPKGSNVIRNVDGSVSLDGKKLPPGTVAQTNPDGSISLIPQTSTQAEQLMTQTNADGTVSVGNVKLPKGSAKSLDGSISLPASSKVSCNADGSVSVDGKKLPPGVSVRTNVDGSLSIVSTVPSQMNLKTNNDGTVSLGDVKLPKGATMNLDGSVTLPKGSKTVRNPDGSITLDGKELPPGTQLQTNKDGSISLVATSISTSSDGTVSVGNIRLPKGTTPNPDGSILLPKGVEIIKNSDGTLTYGGNNFPIGTKIITNSDGSQLLVVHNLTKGAGSLRAGGVLAGLPADASEEEIAERLKAAGLSEADAKMMMKANKGKGLSPEARALMESILASSASQDEISSRVSALLAGTALSTTRGVDKVNGREIDMVQYEGTNLSEVRERKDGFEMPDIPNVAIPELREGAVNGVSGGVRMRDHSGGAGTIKRGSVKRQSEIMREKKKSRQEERDEERERKASYFRKVTGLRRAKVPLMVYSCGGFSRCFRIARFYDVEGPPVGVEYSRPDDDRKSLNPDL